MCHPQVTFTESQHSPELQDRSRAMSLPDLRLAFLEGPSLGKHRITPSPPYKVEKVCLIGILILVVILIIIQCLDFSHFFALHYKCISDM